MDHGKFVAQDTPAKLKDILGGDVVSLEVEGNTAPLEAVLGETAWVRTCKLHNGVFSLTMERGERRIPELVQIAQGLGVAVTSVHLRKPSLEDVFLHFTGHTIRDEGAAPNAWQKMRAGGHGRR